MNEKIIADIVREIMREELKALATKEDLRAFATKEDLEKLRVEMATKEDLRAFATKEDLEKLRAEMATKEDLRVFATKRDFEAFVARIESRMEYFREGVELFLKEHGRLISDIKLKFDLEFRSYDKVMSFLDDVAATVNRGEYEMALHREQTVRELAEIKERIQKIEERLDKPLQRGR